MSRPKIEHTQLFIDGKFVDAIDGGSFETTDPSSGAVIVRVSEAKAADVDAAVMAASRAFERGSVWRTMDASSRGKLLFKLAELVERDASYLASLDALDNGKPYAEALGIDLALSHKCFRCE